MESNLEKRLKKYEKQHKRKKVWMRILSVLSAVVVFCTTYALILPAITQERETFCGFEEHIHSESCSAAEEKILICELTEEEAHLHNEECFLDELICETDENHVHSDECFDENGNLICEKTENHIHAEECYENSLICEFPETEGHSHGDECYEIKSSACETEEHTHTLACYSDETADVETEAQWKAGFANADLGDVVSENLITIAKTQLGYHESTRNYIVLDDGETVKGRTRYGEWKEEPYSDWNTAFIGFCLEYADSEIPFDADIEKWVGILSLPEYDIYRPAAEHEVLPGDIIFLDEDRDGKPDRAGIISEITDSEYKAIIGDFGDSVQAVSFSRTDETVIGFAAVAVPSPYHCGFEEHIHENKCFDEFGAVFCGFEEHRHSEECLDEMQEDSFEETEEPEEEILCEIPEHTHSKECIDEEGNLICKAEEHTHSAECLPEKAETEIFCFIEEHTHGESCFDEEENLICEIEEHSHTDECFTAKEEAEEEKVLFCKMEVHTHGEECFDSDGYLICYITEHEHAESCSKEFFCGSDEHAHSEECFDEEENLICETEEHAHTEECRLSIERLSETERFRIWQVIEMIDALLTAEEIDEKAYAFQDAEDYEGEEAFLTEVYRDVGLAYQYYTDLPEEHRRFITNSEKLMDLEFIWAMALLIETELGNTVEYSPDMFDSSTQFIVYTQGSDGTYYAFNNTGKAVPINITEGGLITASAKQNDIL